MKPFALLTACLLLAMSSLAAQKIAIGSLPAAVQATVRAQTKDATVLNIAKEVENGKTVYEIESKVNGKTRDFVVDAAGTVVEIEEEMDLAAVPAAVKLTIDKQSAGGAVKRIERLTRASTVQYEVAITRNGKTSELTVNGDGSIHKK